MKDFDFFSNISDLIPSNKGGKKESLYKKEILEQMNGKSMKNKRDKIRKMLLTFCSSQRKDTEKEIIAKGMDIFAKFAAKEEKTEKKNK